MSTQQVPLTYEGVLEMFRKTDRKFEAVARQMKRTDKRISDLGGRIGDIVVSMAKGNIAAKFRAFGLQRPRRPLLRKSKIPQQ